MLWNLIFDALIKIKHKFSVTTWAELDQMYLRGAEFIHKYVDIEKISNT